MGHPGQFVIVRDGGWTPYRLSTLYLPTGLLASPAAAVRNIETLGVRRQLWSYCEGGATVDLDRRVLLWYGALPLVPEWLTAAGLVLARTWPGWEIRWAYDGVAELAGHVGVTAAPAVFRDHFAGDALQPAEDPAFVECLVTVRHAGGHVTAHAVDHPEQRSLLARGPALLDQLPEPSGVRPFPVPMTALHLDVAERHATAWGYETVAADRPGWPGWRVTFRGDRFAEQNAACGATVTRPLDLGWAFSALRSHLTATDDPSLPDAFGRFWHVGGSWHLTDLETTRSLAAVDAVTRSTSRSAS